MVYNQVPAWHSKPALPSKRYSILATISLPRRNVLRSAGVSIALPWFASLRGSKTTASEHNSAKPANASQDVKRRMVCIGNLLGFYPQEFWPSTDLKVPSSGWADTKNFEFGRSSKPLESIRDDVTVISGLDHGLKGGHFAIHAFLSGVRQVDAKSMPDSNITVDQFAAESIAGRTRFPSLTIGSESGIHGGCQLSWSRSGTRVPPITGPSRLFKKLFIGTAQRDKAAAADRLAMRGSILDMVGGDAKDVGRHLNRQDKDKLDQFLTSVREVEQRIGRRQSWLEIPKPDAPFVHPKDRNMVEDLPVLYDLIVLALQTDSTRIATLEIGGDFNPRDLGITGGYHALSHHGQLADRIESLITLEKYQMQQFARFIEKLSQTDVDGRSLLDETSVLFGSGMGNANSHTNSNLPVILAGGGWSHGRMLSFDTKHMHRPPLTNLFLSMLQQFGMPVDRFAGSTGSLRGLA